MENYIKGKVIKYIGSANTNNLQTEITPDGEEIKDVKVYKVKIDGKEIDIEMPIYFEKSYNIDIRNSDRLIVANEGNDYYITDIDKTFDYVFLFLIFCIFTISIAKIKGVKAILALALIIIELFYFFIPMVTKGYSPISMSVILAIFSSSVTIFLISGINKKGYIAVFGSILGTIVAGILSFIFVDRMHFTGYSTIEAIGYIDILRGIKIKELVSAGIILGSMGAVMDVSMSLASALHEIKSKNPEIPKHEIFNSGINIGKDMVGTMVNTLILAYVGSSLFDILIINIYLDDLTLTRVLNYEFIATEILKSFAGSIGILAVIPIVSYLSANTKYQAD